MRRWVCIVALLAGFAGDDYARGARLRSPVPIERLDQFDRARQRVAKAEGHRAARVNIAVLAQVLFIGLRRLRDFREAP